LRLKIGQGAKVAKTAILASKVIIITVGWGRDNRNYGAAPIADI
jgi:hypothetical protein